MVEETDMTTHEMLTSMLWLVAGGYAVYVAWFIVLLLRHAHRSMKSIPVNTAIGPATDSKKREQDDLHTRRSRVQVPLD